MKDGRRWAAFLEKLICEEKKFLWGFAKTCFAFTSNLGIIFFCSTSRRVVLPNFELGEAHWVANYASHQYSFLFVIMSSGIARIIWCSEHMIPDQSWSGGMCTIVHCQLLSFLLNLPKLSFNTKDSFIEKCPKSAQKVSKRCLFLLVHLFLLFLLFLADLSRILHSCFKGGSP